MEVLSPYVADGLRKGERCFGAQKASILKQLFYDLRFLGVDVEREIKRGALEFHTEKEVYFPKGRFEPAAMMEMLMESIDDSTQKGFAGFRTAGDLSWAMRGWNMCDQILKYEQMVEKCYPGRAATGICQYCVDEFPPKVLEAVFQAHRFHLSANSDDACRSMLISYEHCRAEVVADKLHTTPRYYYVVEQNRPKRIVGWGSAFDFESAADQADRIAKDVAES